MNSGRSLLEFLPPATKLGQSNIFRSVCQELCSPGGGVQHALRQTPPADGYCCGQYASYWNAFLSCYEMNHLESVIQ